MFIPGAQHDTARLGAVRQREIVYRGAVGVPVQQQRHLSPGHQCLDRLLVDVADFRRLSLLILRGRIAGVAGEFAPLCQWLGKEPLLPLRIANFFPERLVIMVVGAQRIAVAEQHGLAMQFEPRRVVEQPATAVFGEALADQEIAVAVHEVNRYAGIAEGTQLPRDHFRKIIVVVIADPRLEQVAEQVQCVGLPGL